MRKLSTKEKEEIQELRRNIERIKMLMQKSEGENVIKHLAAEIYQLLQEVDVIRRGL